jgi:hypothetical protein
VAVVTVTMAVLMMTIGVVVFALMAAFVTFFAFFFALLVAAIKPGTLHDLGGSRMLPLMLRLAVEVPLIFVKRFGWGWGCVRFRCIAGSGSWVRRWRLFFRLACGRGLPPFVRLRPLLFPCHGSPRNCSPIAQRLVVII